MDDLIKNKKIILICLGIIIFMVGGYYFIGMYKNNTSDIIYEEPDVEIKNYKANEYIPVYMTQEEVMKKYLAEFKNLMLTDPSSAYDLLNEEYRTFKYDNLEDFISYIDELKSVAFYQLTVDKYSIKHINGNTIFDIVGSDGNRYIIKELSIMNYEVYLDNYTVNIE